MTPRRLDQLLASLGYCSRREARAYLKTHDVTIAGEGAKNPATKADPAAVRIDGEPLEHPHGLLLVLHKPAGTICSHDAREGPSVYTLLPERWLRRHPRPETVGRLDKDTTGVLLITDDGQLNHRWTSPHHHVEKTYRATLDGPPDPAWVELLAAGTLQLDGEPRPCRPARLELLSDDAVRLILTEGKFHQVKRMFEALGRTVTTLHREAFGPYRVDDLAEGQWRVLERPTGD